MIFGEALARDDTHIVEMNYAPLRFSWSAKIIIIHWPDDFFYKKSFIRNAIILLKLARLYFWKTLPDRKLVWVVHNIIPHNHNTDPYDSSRSLFFSMLDGLIFLSEASRSTFLEWYPELENRPFVIVRHGHYQAVAFSPATSKACWETPIQLAFVGQVRRYKLPEILARQVATLPATYVRLRIAGNCPEIDLKGELETIAGDATNVELELRRLSERELEEHVDWADVVVLPYRNIVNSGSALLALSRSRPVIAPRLGSLIELQKEVGNNWLYLYDGDLTREVLEFALEALSNRPGYRSPDLSAHDWGKISRNIDHFLRELHSAR